MVIRWIVLLSLTVSVWGHAVQSARHIQSFDPDWRFFKDDAPGAEQPGFDDAAWRTLDVPHDWSIEGPFAETNKTGGAGGFLPSGVAWYRKAFSLPAAVEGRKVFIEFDGVMANSDVWINGHHLGRRPYGYSSFIYELTPHINFGASTNILAVRCDTSAQPASRWYTGAGIYRHVRLAVTDPVRIEHWGTFVTTPEVSAAQATVRVQCTVVNDSSAARQAGFRVEIRDAKNKRVATGQSKAVGLRPGETVTFDRELVLKKPRLWDITDPALYRAVVTVTDGDGNALDDQTVTFGIRDARFTPTEGFVLNGRKVLLQGVCLHHDGGAFGAAVPLGIWEARLNSLRSLGANAIRTAHNPPAPEFLDLCDRMGFLVMDEFFDCWTVRKNPHDYHMFFKEWSKRDVADTVRRDRNHPSVILWSIGNEIHDTPKPAIAIPIARSLVEVCHEHDPTRPVTQALFRPNVSGDYTNGLADVLDVVGTNYRDNELLAAQRNRPEWKIVGTEQRHDRQTWLWARDNPTHAGQFLWTGVDYLGEARPWPLVGHASGLLDRTGAVKPMAFERLSWWSDKPVVRVVRRTAPNDRMPTDPGYGGPELHTQVQFADWTSRNPSPHEQNVEVYSNCDEVELLLNGKSLGSKPLPPDARSRNWSVQFEPGTLKAVGRNSGKVVAEDALRTAGKPVAIQLEAVNSTLGTSWDDVAIIRATIVDAAGIAVPRADNLISFTISGPGSIAVVDNGDNASHEPFQATQRRAFQGHRFVVVKAGAPGRITLNASADGLRGGKIKLKSK